jgi:hypothetical protein
MLSGLGAIERFAAVRSGLRQVIGNAAKFALS